MAKQKSGLHKQVGAIFDGIPNPNEEENDGNGNGVAQQTIAPKPKGYFRPDSMDTEDTAAEQTPPAPQPKVDTPEKRPQPTAKPMETPKKVQPKQDKKSGRGVMLPASLTSKPLGLSLKNKIKMKLDELVEQGGKRQLVMTALIPVLFIILIVSFYNVLKPAGSSTTKTTATSLSATVSTAKAEIVWPEIQPFPASLRDPMSENASLAGGGGLGSSKFDPSNIKVNGILFDTENPAISKAIINGQQVSIGDDISGVKIKDITSKYVEFETAEKVWKQSVGF